MLTAAKALARTANVSSKCAHWGLIFDPVVASSSVLATALDSVRVDAVSAKVER